MELGQRLDHYEIVAKLGEGGMGAVWKARDVRLGRFVAVKELSERTISDEGRRRLVEEARAASILQHPNIVTLLDVADNYLVMEYVAGETLDRLLERTGTLPVAEVLRIGTALAGALKHAHKQGIVHRDLKPANIILGNHGNPKLLDFGLA